MKKPYSPNKQAPRMRKGKFSKSVITKELWKRFVTTYVEYENMTWKEFYDSWQDIAETIRTETISNPLGVKLEKFNGELKFQYLPYKFKANDRGNSAELGEKVPYLNIITRGKVAKIKWERRAAVRYNKMLQFYGFVATRKINELAKQYIDSNPNSIRTARITVGGPSLWRQKK